MIIWIDSEDGTRGGSIYLRRSHEAAMEDGIKSSLVRTNSIFKKLGVIVVSWWAGFEVRGTVPRDLPTLMFCRRKCGYIQSPPEDWSLFSRIAMRLYLRAGGGKAACVSETTRDSANKAGYGVVPVEYARIAHKNDLQKTEMPQAVCRSIIFVIMDNGLVDKGYLRHMSILEEIGRTHEIVVEVYGKGNRRKYTSRGRIEYNDFSSSPFGETKDRYVDDIIFYLGCSRFEGLHMAVVEAASSGIPSVLSDIPAHRELQRIAGCDLLIGRDVLEDVKSIRAIIDNGNYSEEVEKYGQLAENFARAGRTMKRL